MRQESVESVLNREEQVSANSAAKAKKAAGLPAPGSLDNYPLGVQANRKSLEAVIDLAYRQGLIKSKLSVDELFDERTRHLGE